jgi:hypothetical protein
MSLNRADTWDTSKEVTKDDIQNARDEIMRERQESGYGRGMYDYTPEPSVDEIWARVQENKNPYPDR